MNNLITTIFTLHFFNDGIRTAFVTLLPFISKDFHLNFTQVGFLGASQGLLAMLLAIPMGLITSKMNSVRLLSLFLLLYSLSALAVGLSPNFIMLSLFFYLGAVAFAPFHIISQSITARASTKDKIGTSMGSFATIGDLGRVSLPAIALFAANIIGWRNTFVSISTVGFLVFITLLWVLRNRRHIFEIKETLLIEENSKDWLRQMYEIFRQRKLLLVTLAGLIDGIGGAGVYVYLPFLFITKTITHQFLAIFMAIYFAGSLIGKKYLGKSVDYYGPAKIFILAEICMAILLIILTMTNVLVILALITFFLGLFTRGTTPVMMTLFTTVSHEAHYEKVYTISEIFLGGSAVLSPIILGKTADVFGISMTFYLAAAFAVFATVPIYLYSRSKQ